MVSLALSDGGGLRNSTVPPGTGAFQTPSSRSGAARIIRSSVELASSMKENTDSLGHLLSFDLHRWLEGPPRRNFACAQAAPLQFSDPTTTNPWRARGSINASQHQALQFFDKVLVGDRNQKSCVYGIFIDPRGELLQVI